MTFGTRSGLRTHTAKWAFGAELPLVAYPIAMQLLEVLKVLSGDGILGKVNVPWR